MIKAFVLGGFLLFCAPLTAGSAKIVPSFSATTPEGKKLTFDGAHMAKPTLIVFWATWCAPCLEEVPALKKFQTEHGAKVDIIAVNLDDDFGVAKKVIKSKGINYTNVSDEKGNIASKFFVVRTPTLFAINKHGEIIKIGATLADVQDVLLKT